MPSTPSAEVIAGVAFGFLCLSVGVQVASRYLFNVSFGMG